VAVDLSHLAKLKHKPTLVD